MYGDLKTMIILILSCAATLLSAKYVVFSAKLVSVSTFWPGLLSQLQFLYSPVHFYNIDTERISIKCLIMTFSFKKDRYQSYYFLFYYKQNKNTTTNQQNKPNQHAYIFHDSAHRIISCCQIFMKFFWGLKSFFLVQ